MKSKNFKLKTYKDSEVRSYLLTYDQKMYLKCQEITPDTTEGIVKN